MSVDTRRLSMTVGEAMFSQRSIRRFKPDPIPTDDLRLILEAAVKAPNGGNRQVGRFLVLTDCGQHIAQGSAHFCFVCQKAWGLARLG